MVRTLRRPVVPGSWLVRGAAAVVAVALVGGFGYTRLTAAPAKVEPRTATVQKGSITQTVSVTGAVNPAAQVRLNFKSAGRLADVLVVVGQQVTPGQPLARLDTTDLDVALKQAQASLSSAQAKYDQVVAGASPEEIATARQAVDNAQRSLESAQKTTQNDVTTAQQTLYRLRTGYFSAKQGFVAQALGLQNDVAGYQATVDAAKKQSEQALVTLAAIATNFSGGPYEGTTRGARASIAQADGSLGNAQSIITSQVKPALADFNAAYGPLLSILSGFEAAVSSDSDVAAITAPFQSAYSAYTSAQAKLAVSIDSLSSQISSAQTQTNSALGQLAGIPSGLESGRTDINALQTALLSATNTTSLSKSKLTQATNQLATVNEAAGGGYVSAQQGLSAAQDKGGSSLVSAQNTLATAQVSLQKTSASARSFDVVAAQANVLVAQAQLETAQNNLANATLAASTPGVIAAINSQPGEFVSGGSSTNPFILLANTSTLSLHGTVGEADVAKLRLAQVATITLDAIGADKRLTGKIVSLDPVATLQQGVPVYGVDVVLDANDPGIRAGMTGTANVVVASKRDVLVISNLAIRNLGGRRGVQVLRNGETVELTDVRFGIANEQVTEVLGGLNEGDTVLLPAPRPGASPQIRFGGPPPGAPPGR